MTELTYSGPYVYHGRARSSDFRHCRLAVRHWQANLRARVHHRSGRRRGFPRQAGRSPIDPRRDCAWADVRDTAAARRAVSPECLTLAVLPWHVPTDPSDPQLLERLRAATETLELIAADRGHAALLSEANIGASVRAAALVCNPDVRARRTMAKALARRRRRERSDRDDAVLAGTGIRALRRQPVFTTPNVFAPRGFLPRDLAPAEAGAGESSAGGRRPTRSIATSASRSSRPSIISTTGCARRAVTSISRSAPSWPTCAAASRC